MDTLLLTPPEAIGRAVELLASGELAALPTETVYGLGACALDPLACAKFNNFMSKLFGLVFNSDRAACIAQIKQVGLENHAATMTELRSHTIKR